MRTFRLSAWLLAVALGGACYYDRSPGELGSYERRDRNVSRSERSSQDSGPVSVSDAESTGRPPLRPSERDDAGAPAMPAPEPSADAGAPLSVTLELDRERVCPGECLRLLAATDSRSGQLEYSWLDAPLWQGPGPHVVCPVTREQYRLTVRDLERAGEPGSTATTSVQLDPSYNCAGASEPTVGAIVPSGKELCSRYFAGSLGVNSLSPFMAAMNASGQIGLGVDVRAGSLDWGGGKIEARRDASEEPLVQPAVITLDARCNTAWKSQFRADPPHDPANRASVHGVALTDAGELIVGLHVAGRWDFGDGIRDYPAEGAAVLLELSVNGQYLSERVFAGAPGLIPFATLDGRLIVTGVQRSRANEPAAGGRLGAIACQGLMDAQDPGVCVFAAELGGSDDVRWSRGVRSTAVTASVLSSVVTVSPGGNTLFATEDPQGFRWTGPDTPLAAQQITLGLAPNDGRLVWVSEHAPPDAMAAALWSRTTARDWMFADWARTNPGFGNGLSRAGSNRYGDFAWVAVDATATTRLPLESAPAGAPIWITKQGATGELKWILGTSSPVPGGSIEALAVDDDGNVLLAGDFNGEQFTLEGSSLKSEGARDAFVVELDDAGMPRWLTRFGSSRGEWATGIVAGQNRELLLTGWSGEVTDQAAGKLEHTALFLTKLQR